MWWKVALVGAALVMAGCGSESTASMDSPARERPEVSTSAAPTTTVPAPETTVTTTTAAPTTVPPATEPPVTEPPATAPAALMPDVVGMNLQEAQDTIQLTGVFFSRSFDATGAGRSQVIDSNWYVVCQSPSPGTPIGEGDANLGAVKYGESGTC